MLDRTRDYTSREGAHALAQHIRQYWAQRGRSAHVFITQELLPRGTVPIHTVRSRMVGGWP